MADTVTILHTEKVLEGGNKARWPYTNEYQQPTKEGYLFAGWEYNNMTYAPPFNNESTNPFGPITDDTNIKAIWDKIYVFCESNHLAIQGTGDTDSDKTKITYWAELESNRNAKIYDSVTLETVPLDSGVMPIQSQPDTPPVTVVGNKNVYTMKVLANDDPNNQRFAKYRASYMNVKSEVVEIMQAANGEILLPPFDYMTFTYEWELENGKDLDSATVIRDSNMPITSEKTLNDYYVGFLGSGNSNTDVEKYLMYGGDNQESGAEGAYINWRQLIIDLRDNNLLNGVTTLHLDIYANWYNTKGNPPQMNVVFRTFNGTDGLEKNGYVFVPIGDTTPNTEQRINGIDVNAYGRINSIDSNNISGSHKTIQDLANAYSKIVEVEYNVLSKTATLTPIRTVTGRDVRNSGILVNDTRFDFNNERIVSYRHYIDRTAQSGTFVLKNFSQTINGTISTSFDIDINDFDDSYYPTSITGYGSFSASKSGDVYTVNWQCAEYISDSDSPDERQYDIKFPMHTEAGTYYFYLNIRQSKA